MNKTAILEEYKNQEQRLLAAKILDKLEFTKTKNKIQTTDFLNLNEQEMAMKLLKKVDCKNYYFFGGRDNLERKVLVIYPEKLTEEMSRKNDEKILSIIRIKLSLARINPTKKARYLVIHLILGSFGLLSQKKSGVSFPRRKARDS